MGLAFVSGGITGGINPAGAGLMAGETVLSTVAWAMVVSAVTQGIGVATGLQDQFSWVGVAAAGVGAGVGQAVAGGLQGTAYADTVGRFGVVAASSLTGGLAAAVTRGGRINVTQIAADAFGNAIGSSIAEASWGGNQQDSMTAREDFRRSEIEAMNNDARIADALALSGPGMSEADYWNAPTRTMADRYADTYGGAVLNTADRLRLGFGSSSGIDTSQAPSAEYGFVQDYMSRNPNASVDDVRAAYDQAWADQSDAHLLRQARESLMQDSASLRMVGQSADGGLIWNTGAVSYPVGSPDIDVRALTNLPNSTTQPVYDPLTGLPTGYTTEANYADTPSMPYGEQMHNVVGFAGTFGKNFGLGVAQGGIGLVSDAAKGWAMIGDLALTGGSNISRLEQFNLRPFEYDPGVGQFGGAVGEMVSPGAYLKAAELGVVGLRPLGTTADAAIYSYMQRSGGVLGAAPEGNGSLSATGLDWTRISARTGGNAAEHIILNHSTLSLTKPNQGVFYSDPVSVVENAWVVAQKNNIKPVIVGNRDFYVVPRANSGYAGGIGGQLKNFDYVTIITESGTPRIVTSYPSGSTPPIPKGYNFLLGGQ